MTGDDRLVVDVWTMFETIGHHPKTHDESVEKLVDTESPVERLQLVEPFPGVDVSVVEPVHTSEISVIGERFQLLKYTIVRYAIVSTDVYSTKPSVTPPTPRSQPPYQVHHPSQTKSI